MRIWGFFSLGGRFGVTIIARSSQKIYFLLFLMVHHIDEWQRSILKRCSFNAPLRISRRRACLHIFSLWEWIIQHIRLLLLCKKAMGFFHLWELMGKVIIPTHLAREFHLLFLFIFPSSICIRFDILSTSTSFLILSLFTFTSRLLGTLWGFHLNSMKIQWLDNGDDQSNGLISHRQMNGHWLHLVHN